jgi:hypothetical protein
MRVLRRFLLFLSALFAVAAAAFFSYDVFVFQPFRTDIDKLVARAGVYERTPPEPLVRVLKTAYAGTLDAHVARHLIQELRQRTVGGALGWHVTSNLWSLLVKIHLSQGERTTLFLSLSHMGNGQRGFQQASTRIVGVPLAEVSLIQAATLVTVGKSPEIYSSQPERLSEAAEHLAEVTASAP